MKNPLNKRFARELKSEFGKYAVIFLFILAMISAVSGFIIANSSIAVSIVCTLPVAYVLMAQVMPFILSAFSGWLPYYVPFSTFVKMTVLGVVSYFVVAFLQMRKVRKVPMNLALKIVE